MTAHREGMNRIILQPDWSEAFDHEEAAWCTWVGSGDNKKHGKGNLSKLFFRQGCSNFKGQLLIGQQSIDQLNADWSALNDEKFQGFIPKNFKLKNLKIKKR